MFPAFELEMLEVSVVYPGASPADPAVERPATIDRIEALAEEEGSGRDREFASEFYQIYADDDPDLSLN